MEVIHISENEMAYQEPPQTLSDEQVDDGFQWVKRVYIGRRRRWENIGSDANPKNIRVTEYRWLSLNGDAPLVFRGEKRSEKNIKENAVVGGVYWVATNGESVKISGGLEPRFCYRLETEEVVAWCAIDRAVGLAKESIKTEKREARRDLVKERLAPLREVYWDLNHREQRLMVADVLKTLMG